jgi:hypothetical protein
MAAERGMLGARQSEPAAALGGGEQAGGGRERKQERMHGATNPIGVTRR